jgi:mannose-6-phosphate isomerase-like protein (cupin superfamily)
MDVISQDQLPFSRIAHELEGVEHDGLPVSLLFVREGTGTFTAGDEERVAGAGEIVIVPPETPHRFLNTGDGPLRMITIHPSAEFVTVWL